ncbi:hypothetical protein BKN37_14850 [Mycobacterium talmoniae]|uniref:Uncharacterized protein n=1 Tax=Mycobacterium talmoniae TaxID=1858794 RepID=A0A1S1NGF0_9MYCO|nr:hypothetical protein BKN37_14850 [Mycobacterium talmoniae]
MATLTAELGSEAGGAGAGTGSSAGTGDAPATAPPYPITPHTARANPAPTAARARDARIVEVSNMLVDKGMLLNSAEAPDVFQALKSPW